MNDKTEYQYPQTEHGERTPSVKDVRLAEARRGAIEAFTLAQVVQSPETHQDRQAMELLSIGEDIEAVRPKPDYKSDYRLAA